jgi:hypothetical protein
LGLAHEIILVLQGRKALKRWNNAIKATLDLTVVGLQGRIGGLIGERMEPSRRDRRGAMDGPIGRSG